MPINDELYESPAAKGDIAGIAIKTTIALDAVAHALEKIVKGGDITEEIATIRAKSSDIDKIFDELTGWKSK